MWGPGRNMDALAASGRYMDALGAMNYQRVVRIGRSGALSAAVIVLGSGVLWAGVSKYMAAFG